MWGCTWFFRLLWVSLYMRAENPQKTKVLRSNHERTLSLIVSKSRYILLLAQLRNHARPLGWNTSFTSLFSKPTPGTVRIAIVPIHRETPSRCGCWISTMSWLCLVVAILEHINVLKYFLKRSQQGKHINLWIESAIGYNDVREVNVLANTLYELLNRSYCLAKLPIDVGIFVQEVRHNTLGALATETLTYLLEYQVGKYNLLSLKNDHKMYKIGFFNNKATSQWYVKFRKHNYYLTDQLKFDRVHITKSCRIH